MGKKWELYDSKDKLGRKNKACPKCGDGVFLANHKDRLSCGKCGYTEFTTSRKGLDEKGEKQEEKTDSGKKKPKESKDKPIKQKTEGQEKKEKN